MLTSANWPALANLPAVLADWTQFALFHVLPIAVAQIYDWVKEWQILVVGIAAIVSFQLWSRAIMRAARQAARETVLSETKAFDAAIKILRRRIDHAQPAPVAPAARQAPAEARGPASPIAAAPISPQSPPAGDRGDNRAKSIGGLRQAIRLALPAIPLTDDRLSEDGKQLYRSVISYLDDWPPAGASGRSAACEKLLERLSELEQSFPPASCRRAWQSLVDVNALARAIPEDEAGESRGDNSLTIIGEATR